MNPLLSFHHIANHGRRSFNVLSIDVEVRDHPDAISIDGYSQHTAVGESG